jgi:DNA-binding CsgD family transcriptional regulator/PAS domain-containing protein
VSLTLSAGDLDALQQVQTSLLSPLDYPTSDAWRAEVTARVAQLFGADQVLFTLPRTTPGSALLGGQGYDIEGAGAAYVAHYAALDTGMTETRRRRRLEVYHRDHLYDRATLGATEIHVDWALPNHLLDMEGMAFDPLPGELFACLHVEHDHDHRPADPEWSGAFGERGLTVLRVLLPAFKAGVRTHLAFLARREALAAMLDRLTDGAAVWDCVGHCRYRNRALVNLLAMDAERARLERTLADVARRMLARPGADGYAAAAGASDVTLATAATRYRLQATYTAGLGAAEPWVLVLVQAARHLPSPELLRTRYRLTPRQSEVAQRLAGGQSDVAIARALGISRRTAEHHAEAVRLSLGVHSRAALAAALQESV